MRVLYIGLDKRTRVAETNRVKFLSDGFKSTDKRDEMMEELRGPVIVIHTYRSKGGKRLTLQIPEGFDMEGAKRHLLETGWLDLSSCTVKMENLY